MRETYHTPTPSPTGPPHDHTHPRHSQPHHSHSQPRHSREGGNLHTETAPSRSLENSTQSNRIRQNPTETRVRAFLLFPRTHARGNGVPFPFSLHGSNSTYRLELPSYKPHANKSNQTWTGKSDCSVCAACTRIAADWTHRTESPSTGRRRVSFVQGCPLPIQANGTWRKIVFPSQRVAYMLTTRLRHT